MANDPQSNLYSVAGVNAYIHSLLRGEPVLQDIWIQGEVSNLHRAKSGHWYFTIKDNDAQLRCVMFKMEAGRQRIQPDEGDLINVHGRVGVYEARGEYQLYADRIESAGSVGDLYQQFAALKAQLEAEGLFDPAIKQPIPAFALRVGVVTSPDAAAFQDILHVLTRRMPLLEVTLSPTLVQGKTAAPQIVRAIERLNTVAAVDVLLLCRGGGSIEDLWCFNDERVARAIVASKIPVISGVGHETDFTIADFVADMRAPTPSAAAEIVTRITIDDLQAQLAAANRQMRDIMQHRLNQGQNALDVAARNLQYVSPEQRIQDARQRVDEWHERVSTAQQRRLALLRERLQARAAALNAASPDAILKRGYAIVRRQDDDRMITAADVLQAGDAVRIRFADGEQAARIERQE